MPERQRDTISSLSPGARGRRNLARRNPAQRVWRRAAGSSPKAVSSISRQRGRTFCRKSQPRPATRLRPARSWPSSAAASCATSNARLPKPSSRMPPTRKRKPWSTCRLSLRSPTPTSRSSRSRPRATWKFKMPRSSCWKSSTPRPATSSRAWGKPAATRNRRSISRNCCAIRPGRNSKALAPC